MAAVEELIRYHAEKAKVIPESEKGDGCMKEYDKELLRS